jgi:hypothetical protein
MRSQHGLDGEAYYDTIEIRRHGHAAHDGFEVYEQAFFAAGDALAELPDPPPAERFDD